MATLALDNQLLTVIILFKLKDNQQMAVIAKVKELFAIAKKQN